MKSYDEGMELSSKLVGFKPVPYDVQLIGKAIEHDPPEWLKGSA
jgi:hypothetical protein